MKNARTKKQYSKLVRVVQHWLRKVLVLSPVNETYNIVVIMILIQLTTANSRTKKVHTIKNTYALC